MKNNTSNKCASCPLFNNCDYVKASHKVKLLCCEKYKGIAAIEQTLDILAESQKILGESHKSLAESSKILANSQLKLIQELKEEFERRTKKAQAPVVQIERSLLLMPYYQAS